MIGDSTRSSRSARGVADAITVNWTVSGATNVTRRRRSRSWR